MAETVIGRTLPKLLTARSIWTLVFGLAAAFVASAQRIWWSIVNAVSIVADDGQLIRLDLDSPAAVAEAVHAAVVRWRDARIVAALPGPARTTSQVCIFWRRIYAVLESEHNPEVWSASQRGGLMSTISGRQATQAKLHSAGLVDTAGYALCRHAARTEVSEAHRFVPELDADDGQSSDADADSDMEVERLTRYAAAIVVAAMPREPPRGSAAPTDEVRVRSQTFCRLGVVHRCCR